MNEHGSLVDAIMIEKTTFNADKHDFYLPGPKKNHADVRECPVMCHAMRANVTRQRSLVDLNDAFVSCSGGVLESLCFAIQMRLESLSKVPVTDGGIGKCQQNGEHTERC